ncbi:MAG: AAA family ATPase, partial [Christensenellaceae bacterium]
EAAASLSARYITDRFLPDKAIDLIDEAASRARLDSFHLPKDGAEWNRRIAELQTGKKYAISRKDIAALREIEEEIAQAEQMLHKIGSTATDRPSIGREEVAAIVSAWTSIPVSELSEEEAQKLLHLEDKLHRRIIGQEDAVASVAKAIRRARSGLKDPDKPVGTFLFVGPTGVGKTDLAKALAEALFGDERQMIRLDMSEYMEKQSVAKIIGAAPGYVGYDDASTTKLTDRVRSKPYSVVLFDEIEKAHPDVFHLLLQLLDEGRLTDNKGRVVSFRNAVIIMTSNQGASQERASFGFTTAENGYEAEKERVSEALKEIFRPEFLNRLDDIVVFRRLDREQAKKICEKMLDALAERLQLRSFRLLVTEAAKEALVEEGYSDRYGARPLKRVVQRRIEDSLSEEILAGRLLPGGSVVADYIEGRFVFDET